MRTVLTKHGIIQRWRAALDWVIAKHRVEWKQDRYDRMETAKNAVESRKRAIVRERAAGKARERADKQRSDVDARERELASHISDPAHRVAWSEGALSVSDAVIRKSKKEIARERQLQALETKREREKLIVQNEATRQKALEIAHQLDLAMSINFHMCVDCHEFCKAASSLLGRRVKVSEPKLAHVFEAGRCSRTRRFLPRGKARRGVTGASVWVRARATWPPTTACARCGSARPCSRRAARRASA